MSLGIGVLGELLSVQSIPASGLASRLTWAKIEVFPPSGGPVNNTVGGPALRELVLDLVDRTELSTGKQSICGLRLNKTRAMTRPTATATNTGSLNSG